MRNSQQMQPARKLIVSSYRCAFVAIVSFVLLAACGLLRAQTGGTGAISGAITDPAGAMEMCIRDRPRMRPHTNPSFTTATETWPTNFCGSIPAPTCRRAYWLRRETPCTGGRRSDLSLIHI